MADIDFEIDFEGFQKGQSPVAHIDSKTYFGDKGQASEMKADIISLPGFVTQSPALADLTNGNQDGNVADLIRTILDTPTATDFTYAVGATGVYKLSSTEVFGSSVCHINQQFTNRNAASFLGTVSIEQIAQQFTPSKTGKVCKVTVNLAKMGSPTDNINLRIYDLDGSGYPNTLLGTSDTTLDGSTLPIFPSNDYYDFAFASGPSLTAGTKYAIVLTRSGAADNSNYFYWFGGTARLYSGGDSVKYNGSVWSVDATLDLYFQQYTEDTWPKSLGVNIGGEGMVRLKQNLYIFYNGYIEGDIAKMPLESEVIEADWGSSTDQTLEPYPHPVAAKEDIMVFGNGRYAGVYIEGTSSLTVQKLDFGEGNQVDDVVFHNNVWWLAVNRGEGKKGQIYVYDGSAISTILSDEVGVGDQEIGFLYVLNGVVYVACQDKSSDGYIIGRVAGDQLEPLRYFSGSLPNYRQKALYKNTIIFVSGANIMSFGTPVKKLPLQISTLADGGHATLGGIASPFGTPMIASSDGGNNHRLAKFSGLATDSNWKSVFVDVTNGRMLGKIHTVIVYTKALVGDARCDLKIQGNQGAVETDSFEIQTANKTRHVLKKINLKPVEDVRLVLDYANGDSTNGCPIRKVKFLGNYVER